MEILRENFHSELPWIQQAISECDFIAIDAEFSGLHIEQNKRTQTTTLEESYTDLRKSATQFMTVQIGIATFTFDKTNGSYIAKPFNFYIFPTTLAGFAPQGRCFLTEASSMDFLAKNRFDFNKWIYHGVHYMTKEEEAAYRKDRLMFLNNEQPSIAVDSINTEWIAGVVRRVETWKKDPKAVNFINIQTNNSYQRRLVYQELRRIWPMELQMRGQEGGICVTQTNAKQVEKEQKLRMADLERDIKLVGGFRSVIDILSKCGKPIVGHNVVIDLAYILAQFVGPLPETIEGYKRMIHQTFPKIIDTKYVSYTAEALRGLIYDTSLGGLENVVKGVHFIGSPRITLNYRHPRYYSHDHAHEAGYDAYSTGSVLIKLMSYIAKKGIPPPSTLAVIQQNSKVTNLIPQKTKKKKAATPEPVSPKAQHTNRATPPRPSTPVAVAAVVPAPVEPAPVVTIVPVAKKPFSYADIVHRQQKAAATTATATPTVNSASMTSIQSAAPTGNKPTVTGVHPTSNAGAVGAAGQKSEVTAPKSRSTAQQAIPSSTSAPTAVATGVSGAASKNQPPAKGSAKSDVAAAVEGSNAFDIQRENERWARERKEEGLPAEGWPAVAAPFVNATSAATSPSNGSNRSNNNDSHGGNAIVAKNNRLRTISQDSNSNVSEMSEESDYEYIQQRVAETFEAPFQLEDPLLRGFQNIVHWGRSSHGCINLLSH